MEGRPSIRVKLMFHDNPHGADPVANIAGVLTFPGRGHKGVVKPGQLWDCDVVFASFNYVMIAPRVELEDALDDELGVFRYYQGAREVAHIKLPEAMDLLRSGQVPPPVVTPRPLPPRKPVVAPAKAAPSSPPSTPSAPGGAPKSAIATPAKPTTQPSAPPAAASTSAAVPPPPPQPQPVPPAPTAPAQPAAVSVKAAIAEPAPSMAPPVQPPAAMPTFTHVVPVPTPARAEPAVAVQTARTFDDWRRALDGPDGRALVELLTDRLGISRSLPHIEDALDGQDEVISVLRGEASDIRKSVKDLGGQIEDIRKQTLAWRRKENQDLRGISKPFPKDPDHPTDEEVEREIIHQLYQKNCWGNKYGQYEKLKRGYNGKASDRQVRAAVQRLQEKRWILIYAKDTDQFRLNPARAEDIYRFLGVPDRAAEFAEDTREELAEPAALTKRDLEEAMDGVATRTDIERVVAPLRQKINTLEERAPISVPVVEAALTRSNELTEIKGLLRGLQGELNRVKKLAEDTASAQRRLEQLVKEKAES